jgi:hypothetical protein
MLLHANGSLFCSSIALARTKQLTEKHEMLMHVISCKSAKLTAVKTLRL